MRRDVDFFPSVREALAHGFRPCKRCRPLLTPGETPAPIQRLVEEIEADPSRRLRDRDLRAVARANGDNPIAIVMPCHRVVGADGKLTGYGGGLWRKRWNVDGTLPTCSLRNTLARRRRSI